MTRRAQNISFGAVKAATDLADLVTESGVEISRHGMALCPFHGDRRPSLSVRGDRWRCFGCGEHGDVFDWCERFYKIGTGAALRFLAERAGFAPAGPGGRAAPEAHPDAEAEIRKKQLRDRFFSWVWGRRTANADLIRKIDHTIDLVVRSPDDLCTDRAEFLYDSRARAEGIDELLWGRDWEALAEYYREETIDES